MVGTGSKSKEFPTGRMIRPTVSKLSRSTSEGDDEAFRGDLQSDDQEGEKKTPPNPPWPMSPDEMVEFEKEVVQRKGETDVDNATRIRPPIHALGRCRTAR